MWAEVRAANPRPLYPIDSPRLCVCACLCGACACVCGLVLVSYPGAGVRRHPPVLALLCCFACLFYTY